MEEIVDENELMTSNLMSGTFRWKSSKKLANMPPLPITKLDITKGWMPYFLSRCDTNEGCATLIKSVQSDLSQIDCLSSPLTIAHVITSIKGISNTILNKSIHYDEINLIVIGCSSKAEERILRETNCWHELLSFFPNTNVVNLWLCGPEISETKENLKTNNLHSKINNNKLKRSMKYNLYKGTAMEFFRSYSCYLNSTSIIIGLNCGFGNFENPMPKKYDLLMSWLPDLYFLTGLKIPIIFTCANDYADLLGEVSIMIKILGANFISLPMENQFGFASTMIPPVTSDSSPSDAGEYSRGNSFFYAVQGNDCKRRKNILRGNNNVKRNKNDILADLNKLLNQKSSMSISCSEYLIESVLNWPVKSKEDKKEDIKEGKKEDKKDKKEDINEDKKLKEGNNVKSKEDINVKLKEDIIEDTILKEDIFPSSTIPIDSIHNNDISCKIGNSKIKNESSNSNTNIENNNIIKNKISYHFLSNVEQKIEIINDCKAIKMTIYLPLVESIHDVILDLSDLGDLLYISTTSNTNLDEPDKIKFIELIVPSSIKAKFSKKKKILTIICDVIK
jgi:hypothetical protein